MPTVAELRRLDELERAWGVANGVAGIATVEVCPDDPMPNIEIEGFEGTVVVIRSGAIPSGSHRCCVNGEWRSGLPPREYTPWSTANDGTQASLAKAPSSSLTKDFRPNGQST